MTDNSAEQTEAPAPLMWAKLEVLAVEQMKADDGKTVIQEEITMMTVGGDKVQSEEGYPEDGSDEDNTYASFTPSADLKMHIANPALFGRVKTGDRCYVDFTKSVS